MWIVVIWNANFVNSEPENLAEEFSKQIVWGLLLGIKCERTENKARIFKQKGTGAWCWLKKFLVYPDYKICYN